MELPRRNSKSIDSLFTSHHTNNHTTSSTSSTSTSSTSSTSSMDMNRNKRKSVVSTNDASEFSQASILSAMDKFVSAVNNMDDTIMVPSRLMDMPLDVPSPQPAHNQHHNNHNNQHHNNTPNNGVALNNTDLFGFYNMLNTVKNELIWGPSDRSTTTSSTATTTATSTATIPTSDAGKTSSLTRRMSTLSVHSYSDSDVESESSNDFDSGVDVDEQSVQVANAFRQHLTGLFQALHQLTDAANYLTTRYQDEVDGSSS